MGLGTVHLRSILLRRTRLRPRRLRLRSVIRSRIRPVVPSGRFGRTTGRWLIHLWTVVRLRRSRAIIASWRFERTICFRCSRSVRCWLIRRRLPWCGAVVRGRHGSIIPGWWLKRPIPGLVGRALVSWLWLSGASGIIRSRHATRAAACRLIRCRRWCNGSGGRHHVHTGRGGSCRWRCQSGQLLPWNRLTGMFGEHLLTRRKRWWRWRRSCFGDDLAIRNRRRRSCDATRGIRMCTQNCLRRRRHGGSCHHRRVPELLRIHLYGVPSNGLRAGECTLRHRGHCAIHVPVHIRDVVYGRVVIDDRGVVHVRHCCLINSRIRDVDLVYIRGAGPVGGNIHLTRS